MMLKSYQNSACDGEQLKIKCNDDYIIDVITAEHTILVPQTGSNSQQQQNNLNGFSRTSAAAAAAADDQSASETKDTKPTFNSMDSICAPFGQPNHSQHATPDTTSNLPIAVGSEQQTGNGNINNSLVASSNNSNSNTYPNQTTATTTSTTMLLPNNANNNNRVQPQQTNGSHENNAAKTMPNAYNRNDAMTQTGSPKSATLCNKEEAESIASAQSSQLIGFVRNECHLKGACVLDLRPTNSIALAANSNSTTSNSKQVSKLISEVCPLNRKIVEVVYKCRPMRFTKRVVCKGSPLQLNCTGGPDKRILVAGAEFGSWANDKNRCESRASSTGALIAAPVPLSAAASTGGARSTCHAPTSSVTRAVFSACLMQQRCKLDVIPSVLGDTKCPPDTAEYIKVMFTCVSESLIHENSTRLATTTRTSNSNYRPSTQQETESQPLGGLKQAGEENQTFVSSNVSSSSLLRQHQTAFLTSTSGLDQQQNRASMQLTTLAPPSAQETIQFQYPPQVSPSTHLSVGAGSGGSTMGSGASGSSHSNDRLLNLMLENPDLANLHPSQWSFGQRARFLALRYQPLLVLTTVATAVILTMAFILRVCLANNAAANGSTRKQSTGAKGRKKSKKSNGNDADYSHQLFAAPSTSSSSSAGSSASSFGPPSSGSAAAASCTNLQKPPHLTFGDSNELLPGGGGGGGNGLPLGSVPNMFGQHSQHHSYGHQRQLHLHQPHQSGSESCFSLDDYNLNASTPNAADSPALRSSHTPHDTGAAPAAAPPTCFAGGAARPKLWTIYGTSAGASTMRAPSSRTFASSGGGGGGTMSAAAGPPPPPPTLRTPMGAVESWCATLLSQQQQQQQHQSGALHQTGLHQLGGLLHQNNTAQAGAAGPLCPAHQQQLFFPPPTQHCPDLATVGVAAANGARFHYQPSAAAPNGVDVNVNVAHSQSQSQTQAQSQSQPLQSQAQQPYV